MKIAKWMACVLIAAVVVFTIPPAVQAAENLEIWPIAEDNVKGDRSKGQLTIYYEVVEGVYCDLEEPFTGQDMVKMIFLLKLYEKNTKTWHIITAENEGPFCLTGDVATQFQQQALLDFLQNNVRPALDGSVYSAVYLKDVTDDFENTATGPLGPPYCVSAEITIVAVE